MKQKQIVITSDESPQEIDMAECMRSRFASGFQAEVQPPGIEERVAILMQKAVEMSIPLNETMAFYLAENVDTSSVRDLIGALKRVGLYADFYGTELTIEIAEKALTESKQLKKSNVIISPQELISAVADNYNVKLSDLVSKKRTQSVVHPRQVAMYLMKERLGMSLKEIGEQFKRDHSTVKYAVDSIRDQIADDEYLRDVMKRITAKIFR
jgi:chromosomal replication initiator protein